MVCVDLLALALAMASVTAFSSNGTPFTLRVMLAGPSTLEVIVKLEGPGALTVPLNDLCRRDPKSLHGPHLYITYRLDGKSRSLYGPPEHAPAARKAQQAWAEFWEVGCALAALNREQLRRRWQQEKKTRKTAPAKESSHD